MLIIKQAEAISKLFSVLIHKAFKENFVGKGTEETHSN